MKVYQADGTVIDIPNLVLNDLNLMNILPDIPGSEFYMPIVQTNLDGQRQMTLVAASVLRQPRLDLAAQVAAVSAVQTKLTNKIMLTLIGTTTVSIGGVILGAGNKPYSKTVTGVINGEPILCLTKGSLPSGYLLGGCSSTATDTIELTFNTPALVIGTVITPQIEVYAMRSL